jgi:hypothetical protein
MTRSHVQQQLNLGKNYLVCIQHKTAETYGDLAKHVFSGTQAAMQVYLDLTAGMSDGTFLVSASKGVASIPYYLMRVGSTYFPSYLAPNSNLIRKQYHTVLMRMSQKGRCLDLLSKVDAHSKQVSLMFLDFSFEVVGNDDKGLFKCS